MARLIQKKGGANASVKQISILKRPNSSKGGDKKWVPKKKVRFDGIPSDREDEDDMFSGLKDRIGLDSAEDESEDSLFDEEPVFDLPDDDEDLESDEDTNYSDEEDEGDSEEDTGEDNEIMSDEEILNSADSDSEDETDSKWGKNRKNYYDADVDALEEEAEAADKLQKKKLAGMKREDFGLQHQSKFTLYGPITLKDEDDEAIIWTLVKNWEEIGEK